MCGEVAAGPLPRLTRLSLHRSSAFGQGAPSVSDAGLATLCSALAGQLTWLSLTGHTRMTDEGVRHLARLVQLTHLELRLSAPSSHW